MSCHLEHAAWEFCSEDGWVLSIEWMEPGSDRVIYASYWDLENPGKPSGLDAKEAKP